VDFAGFSNTLTLGLRLLMPLTASQINKHQSPTADCVILSVYSNDLNADNTVTSRRFPIGKSREYLTLLHGSFGDQDSFLVGTDADLSGTS
jgi:hypothetical protein